MSQDEPTVSVPAGFRAVRRPDEFWEKVAQGIWEPATVRVLETVLTPASTHIDVGAWIGPTVLLAATRADHVLAFEPDPVAYAELDRNVALNPDLASRVDLRREALFDRSSVMRMASNSDHLGDSGASLIHRDVTRRETVNVPTLDARQVAAEPAFAACDLIKIDIEGAEYVVVPRLAQWLRLRQPVLLLGLHGYPIYERFTWAPKWLAKQLRRLITLTLRLHIAVRLWTHRYWYLPDDCWTVGNDSWAPRQAGLHPATVRERWMILTRVRDIDVLMSPRSIPEFGNGAVGIRRGR
jgi:FkbM family methyltransferase